MLALGAAAPGALGRYRTGLRDLNTLYPDMWGVISRADHAMRFEQWARMAFEAPPSGDWSTIVAASAYGEEGARQAWWDRQVCKPAGTSRPHQLVNALEGYTPRGATLTGDRGTSAAPSGPPAGALPQPGGPPPKRPRRGGGRGGGGEGAAAQPAGVVAPPPPAPPKAGTGVCFAYNLGTCTAGAACRYPHRCSVCGVEHPAFSTSPCRDKIDAVGRPTRAGRRAAAKSKAGGR